MSEETVRNHIRAALEAIVATKKAELHAFRDASEAMNKSADEMMAPIIVALKEMQDKVAPIVRCQIEIEDAIYGHRAAVYFGMRSGELAEHSVKIQSGGRDTRFQVDVFRVGFNAGGIKEYYFDSAEDVVNFVLEAAGEHVASRQVLLERKA
jgi:hypothetical protein